MEEKNQAKFPKFECVISNTMEDFDSEMERFFITKNKLAVELSRLRLNDEEWADNYHKMMLYLSDLIESLLKQKEPPSYQFLIDLSLGDELEDKTTERLLRSRNPLVADTTGAVLLVRDLMYWFVRNSKNAKLEKSFTPDRFLGLPFLRLSLAYRSVRLSHM